MKAVRNLRTAQTVKKVVSQKIVHKKFSGRTRTALPSWNQKAVDSKGKAFGRVPPDAKSFAFIKDQEGRRNSPVGCCVVGNPIKGFPDAASHAAFVHLAICQPVFRHAETEGVSLPFFHRMILTNKFLYDIILISYSSGGNGICRKSF